MIKLEFNNNYKGKYKDILSEKFNTFLTCMLFAGILLFIAIYLCFLPFSRIKTPIMLYSGFACYLLSFVVLIISFIIPIFTNKNKSFKGIVSFLIDTDNFTYTINAIKNKFPFSEKGKINYFENKKRAYYIGLNSIDCYRIPKKFVSKEQALELSDFKFQLSKKIKDDYQNQNNI